MPALAVVGNRETQFFPPYPKPQIKELLSFRPKGYFWSPKYRMRIWDGWVSVLKRDTCPTGCFLEMAPEFKKNKIRFEVEDNRVYPKFRDEFDPRYQDVLRRLENIGKDIRNYQDKCVAKMVEASNCGGIILAATGTGKTQTVGIYFARLEGSAVFVVDELALLDQSRAALEAILGEKVGIVGASQFAPERITVATAQTLGRHSDDHVFRKWMRSVDVFVIDELHVQLAKRNFDSVAAAQPKAVFGVTGTLQVGTPEVRLKASALCGPVIFTYSLDQGTKEGHLTPGIVCSVVFENEGYPRNVDPKREYLDRVVKNRPRNNIVEGLAREALKAGLPTVILVERIPHLKVFCKRFEDVQHEAIWGERSREDRKRAKADFDAGKYSLMIASRVFAKGVDIAKIAVIIDATAMRSANSAGQRFGRGTRLSEDKKGLIYFDVADVTPELERRRTRLHEASQDRWRAYGALKIPRIRVKWSSNPRAIFAHARREMDKVVASVHAKPLV
jgi:superfamily II DNA or RNA helicase